MDKYLSKKVCIRKKTFFLLRLFLSVFFIMTCVSGINAAAAAAPKAVTKLTAEAAEQKICLKWKKVKNAEGYIVRYKNASTGEVIIKKLKGNPSTAYLKYNLKKLDYVTRYYIWVAAYKGEAVGEYTRISSKTIIRKPDPPVVTVASRDVAKVVISWKKVKYATYYEVYQRINGKRVLLKKTKKLQFSKKGLQTNTTYKFYVRAVRKLEGNIKRGKLCSVYVTPENVAYYRSLANSIDDGNVYDGGGNPYRTYSDAQLEAYANFGNYGESFDSSTGYLVWCNRRSYHLFVFTRSDSSSKWRLLYSWPCIIGAASNPTMRGFYTLSRVSTYHSYGYNHARYLTSYSGDNMIHSLLYPSSSDYLSAGYMSSLGCIRVTCSHAQFIYENCSGATLVIR